MTRRSSFHGSLTSVSIRLLGLDILSVLSRGFAMLCAHGVGLRLVSGVWRVFSPCLEGCEVLVLGGWVVECEMKVGGGGVGGAGRILMGRVK